jgi:hypothetical protein
MIGELFAEGFSLQHALATGLIGAGVGGAPGGGQWVKRKMEERKAVAAFERKPAKLWDLYLLVVLTMAVCMAVIFAGIAWRANAR